MHHVASVDVVCVLFSCQFVERWSTERVKSLLALALVINCDSFSSSLMCVKLMDWWCYEWKAFLSVHLLCCSKTFESAAYESDLHGVKTAKRRRKNKRREKLPFAVLCLQVELTRTFPQGVYCFQFFRPPHKSLLSLVKRFSFVINNV